jgi:hypothetical protein
MKESFIERNFSSSSMNTIDLVNGILNEYGQQGYKLSLRQLYYQMVSRDYIPNTQRSYKNLGSLVSNARQAGLVDWEMIEDRNRETNSLSHWLNPAQIVQSAAEQFRIDKWKDQPYHIEVMVEKDALSGVLLPVCQRLDVGITANKGYSSSSTMYEIGKRLQNYFKQGKTITVIYLGDHDPSGIDMSRDVQERLQLYSQVDSIEFVRVALNFDQVKELKPPENPAKESDARYGAYVRKYGRSSWELDAVEPVRLATLVRDAVVKRRDNKLWEKAIHRQEDMREELKAFVEQYNNNQSGEDE